MAIESVTYISDFVATNPVGATDAGSTLGNHIRNMKTGIKATFPNVSGAVSPTHTQLNQVGGTWTEKQTFSNYTVLGAGPAIKMKKLTGTTNSAQGANAAVAHGLTDAKIISFQTLVTHVASPVAKVHAGYTATTGYEFNESLNDGNIVIENAAGNSANILSKPFTVLITYEE